MSSSLSLYTPDMDNNLVLDPELHLDDLYQSGPDSGYNSLESAGMSTSGSHADFGPGAGDQQYLDRQWSGVDSVPHTCETYSLSYISTQSTLSVTFALLTFLTGASYRNSSSYAAR